LQRNVISISNPLDTRELFKINQGCKSVDIRDDVKNFERLEHCRTVYGDVRLSNFHYDRSEVNKTFDDLFVIRGFLLIDNVTGLESIGWLFPNLTFIYGDTKYDEYYSLVISNMKSLLDIGLELLTFITSGLILIENNSKLCYVNTIDWSAISKQQIDFDVSSNSKNLRSSLH
jgi:hypothetical protein